MKIIWMLPIQVINELDSNGRSCFKVKYLTAYPAAYPDVFTAAAPAAHLLTSCSCVSTLLLLDSRKQSKKKKKTL